MKKLTWTEQLRVGAVVAGCSLALGCGSAPTPSSDERVGTEQSALNAGNNSQFVSSTIPTAMAPGERLDVQVVMKNTGTVLDGTNTWTTSAYSLYRTVTNFGWVSTPVSVDTTVGNNATFNFVITSPASAGTYSFGAKMKQDVQFGATAAVNGIVVSAATTPKWSCSFVSTTAPTTMTPGENRSISVVVKNAGTATWTSADATYLKSLDNPAAQWGVVSVILPSSTAAGANATFTWNIKAPTTPGSYTLQRQINNSKVGFLNTGACVNLPITVAGSTILDSSAVSNTFTTPMAPGETRSATVTMQNTGSETWATGGNYTLFSKNSPTSLWGVTSSDVTVSTATGANAAMNLVVTAPSTPGTYHQIWQMRKISGTNAGFFGATIDVPIVVDASATAQYNASVATQTIPPVITVGKKATFSITMQNTGSSNWSGTGFGLYSTNSPVSRWTLTGMAQLASDNIATNGQKTFNLVVTAPTTAGTYDSHWRMKQTSAGGIGFFGTEAVTTGIVVTNCGNSAVDAGEQCDDGNLNNGDGCSDTCQSENAVTIDLATQTADRTILGTQTQRLLGNVDIGDVTGDGTPDVAVGQNTNVVISGKPTRTQAGQVDVYSGANVFTAGASVATIQGAESSDMLGIQGTGGVKIGDVTGDGKGDLIISAPGADGVGNMRSGCGEVYVMAGGALSGTIDLAAATPPWAARIIGSAASKALRVLAVGELTGDTVADLVLGEGAAVYVVKGSALSGDIDLASPPAGVYAFTGTGVGGVAAIGNFVGTSTNDLIIGAPSFTHTSSQDGAAFGWAGPISAGGTIGSPTFAWYGAGANDNLGQSIAIGDVLGSTAGDVLLGASQQRKAGNQVGAVDIWSGAGFSVAGGTFDLAAGAVPTTTILGQDQFDNLGSSLQVADWNKDGIKDIAVGAYAADGPSNARSNTGELYVILGSRAMATSIDLATSNPIMHVYGAAASDLLGRSMNNLSFMDIDGDGAADICVGSSKGGTNGGVTQPGRVDCFR